VSAIVPSKSKTTVEAFANGWAGWASSHDVHVRATTIAFVASAMNRRARRTAEGSIEARTPPRQRTKRAADPLPLPAAMKRPRYR
jgi:hypothetical protein